MNDAESLGDGQSDFDGVEELVAPEPEPAEKPTTPQSLQPSAVSGVWNVDLVHLFSIRTGELAVRQIVQGHQAQNEDRHSRVLKLFVLLPRCSSSETHPDSEDTPQLRRGF